MADIFADAVVVEEEKDDTTVADPFATAETVDDPFASAEVVSENEQAAKELAKDPAAVYGMLDKLEASPGDAVDLPTPSWDMYKDLEISDRSESEATFDENYAKAQRRYKLYAEHPDTKPTVGGLMYKGTLIPSYDPSAQIAWDGFMPSGIGYNFDPGLDQKAMGVANNAYRSVFTLIGDLIDFGADKSGLAGDDYEPMGESLRKDWGRAEAGSGMGNNIFLTGGQMIAPGALFSKAFQIGKAGTKVNKASKFLGFEAGAAAGADEKTSTLFTGDKAGLVNIWDGIEAPEGSPEYAEMMALRGNVLLEGMVLGKAFEKTIDGAVWVAKFTNNQLIQPFRDAFSTTAKEEKIAQEIVRIVSEVTDEASAKSATDRIAKLVEENKNSFVKIGDEEKSYILDTMSALEKGIRNGELTDDAIAEINRARGIKSGVRVGANSDKLVTAEAKPATVLEDSLGGMDQGTAAINKGSDELASTAQGQLDDAGVTLSVKQGELEAQVKRTMEDIYNDPSMAGVITRLERETGVDIGVLSRTSADQALERLQQASKSMDETKNGLFNKIQGGQVDPEDLLSTLDDLIPDQMTQASLQFPGNPLFSRLISQSRPQRIMDVDAAGKEVSRMETPEETLTRFSEFLTNSGVDFGKLFTEVRPSVVDSINMLERGTGAEKAAAGILVRFKKWIDEDAVKYVKETGDPKVAKAVDDAMSYHKNVWAKFWDDGGPLAVVGSNRRMFIDRGKQVAAKTDESRNAVTDALTDRTRATAGNIIDLLRREETGGNPEIITQYFTGQALKTLAPKLADGSLDQATLRSAFNEYIGVVRQNFPQQAKALDDIATRIEQNIAKGKTLEEEVRILQESTKEATEQVRNGVLGRFLAKDGEGVVDGYTAFKKLLDDPNAMRIGEDGATSGQLADLVRLADESGDPVIRDALESAYARWLNDKLLNYTRGKGGARNLSEATVEKINSELSPALKYGDEIFKDKPEVMQAIRTLVDDSTLVSIAKNAKGAASSSNTAELGAANQVVDRVITMVFGVLNRVGARLRIGSKAAMNAAYDTELRGQIIGRIMAEPDYFLEILKRVQKEPAISRETYEMMRSWMVRGSMFDPDSIPDLEEFAMTVMDAESAARQKANDVIEQTNQALKGQ